MSTLTVELPDNLEAFVAAQTAAGGFGSPSLYVQELIRRAQLDLDGDDLETRLLAGVEALDRGEGRELSPADWQRLLDRFPLENGTRP